jgi:uncharacterized membrane protein YphA (DoxX/SURF4 family)
MRDMALVGSSRTIGDLVSTGLLALVFGSGGVAYLAGGEAQLRGMAELGYPAYFVTVLGVFKVLGALAILTPRLPRLREWAYAGMAFDLLGAAASHAAVGHPFARTAVPLVFLAVLAVSWRLADGRTGRSENVCWLRVQTARA